MTQATLHLENLTFENNLQKLIDMGEVKRYALVMGNELTTWSSERDAKQAGRALFGQSATFMVKRITRPLPSRENARAMLDTFNSLLPRLLAEATAEGRLKHVGRWAIIDGTELELLSVWDTRVDAEQYARERYGEPEIQRDEFEAVVRNPEGGVAYVQRFLIKQVLPIGGPVERSTVRREMMSSR
jgi:hypothetical protein